MTKIKAVQANQIYLKTMNFNSSFFLVDTSVYNYLIINKL